MPADGIDPHDSGDTGEARADHRDGSPRRSPHAIEGQDDLLRRRLERQRRFHHRIGRRALERLRARREPDRTLFHALASSGMVGWSVVVPTLLGLAAGRWLDRRFAAPWSWTLTLMLSGLALGCWNAWQWIVSREDDQDDDDTR
jgi:ATP synthase protein I